MDAEPHQGRVVSSHPAPATQYDLLTINNNSLLDLESEPSSGGLLPGPDVDLEAEVESVEKLLVGEQNGQSRIALEARYGCGAGTLRQGGAGGTVYSHSRQRAHEITYDNSRLVQRLVKVAAAQPVKAQAASEAHDRHIANVMASSLKLRRLGEERLVQANVALYQRLQAVRPSKDVDKVRLGADYRRSRGYLINLRTVPDAAPAPAAALQSQPKAWNERWQARPSTC